MSAILALLITVGATMILTSNLALADSKAPSGMAAIMGFNKIGSSSSSSSIYASSSTANDPYEHITGNNIYPLQRFGTIRDESPLASRTNTNNFVPCVYNATKAAIGCRSYEIVPVHINQCPLEYI